MAPARHAHLAVPAAADHRARAPRHPGEAVQADRLEPAGADDRLGQEPLSVISVFDCADAARAAFKAGVPNEAYNLGSLNPPPVRKLLGDLIRHAGSKSLLVPTPGWAVKRTLDLLDLFNMPIMDPEQYLIADEMCVLDVGKAGRQLGWVPQYRDEDMLIAAYKEYRLKKDGHAVDASHVPAE